MKSITDEELDRAIENGDDLGDYIDPDSARHFYYSTGETRQITITIPSWLVITLDMEASRRAIARKALINSILVDWADSLERTPQAGQSGFMRRLRNGISATEPNDYEDTSDETAR